MQYRRRHDRDQPRSWFSLFVRSGGWVALIFGVVLVVLTLFSASSLYLADRMDRDGRYTNAAVVDKRYVTTTDNDGSTSTEYFVTFSYKTGIGGRESEAEVYRPFYDQVEVGDLHVIRYLRDAPGQIEYREDQYRRNGNTLRNIGLVMGLLGLVALWFFGRKANWAIKARRDGERRTAVVTGIRELKFEVNNRRQGRLMWREEDGQEGESLMRDVAELGRLYKGGDPIVVFRLGQHVFWEGDVGPPRRQMK